MEKTVNVTYDGEVFRPDEPVDLASNARGTVILDENPKTEKLELVEMPKTRIGEPHAWLDFAMEANLEGPSDFSTNLDDYLYGGKSLDNER